MARLLLAIFFIAIGHLSQSAVSFRKEPFPDAPETVIAIDLGTRYARVGVCNYSTGVVKIIAEDQRSLINPSLIAFTDTEKFIDEAAKSQAALYPGSTISFYVKRFEDEEVQSDMKLVPYKIVNKDGKPYFQVKIMDGEHKLFSPEEITTVFLTKMKETANDFLGKEINDAVITIPAYFNEAQKQATKDAGIMAGLNVLRLIVEPYAAAKAYHLNEVVSISKEIILVFDLGGGTFDVTVFSFQCGSFEILATNADMHLAGNDFDWRIMEYFIMVIKKKYGKDITKDNKALVKLRAECERAKMALSIQHEVQVEIKSLFDGVDFSEPLTRAQFEELNNDLFIKIIGSVKKVMEDAGLETQQIDDIILVGGSSKIPKIRQLLKDYFDESEANKVVEPEIDEIVLVGGSTEIPKFRPLFQHYFDGNEATKGVDPSEAIAVAAAREGAHSFSRESLIETYRDFSLFTPFDFLPYGIRTAGGVMTKLIPRPMNVPLKTVQVFTTNRDNQTRISIEIYEGEKNFTRTCELIGKFELTGIPPAPRGTPRIEITTEIDSVQNIYVKAEDKGTGKSERIKIRNNRHWSDEVYERNMCELEEIERTKHEETYAEL